MTDRRYRLIRVRRIDPDGTVRESRYYVHRMAARARADRWRRAGWTVEVATSTVPVAFQGGNPVPDLLTCPRTGCPGHDRRLWSSHPCCPWCRGALVRVGEPAR